MIIGDLNKRIVLQYKTKVADSLGSFTTTWTDFATVFAAIWPVSAKEVLQAGQNIMTVTGRIRIRYRSNVGADYRIKYGNKYYSISSIINPGMKNEWLDLLYKEAV